MADIHILEASISRQNGAGTVTVVYHCPVDKTNNSYPGGQETIVPDLGQQEKAGLADGTLYEHSEHLPVNLDALTPVQLADLIQARWHVIANVVQEQIDLDYRHYGQTLARS